MALPDASVVAVLMLLMNYGKIEKVALKHIRMINIEHQGVLHIFDITTQLL